MIPPSGDPACPPWCAPDLCSPEICHRTEGIEIDTAEATITLSVRQWRNGWPDEFKPGWLPPRISWFISHKVETIDFGFPEGGPIIVHASEPMALSIHFGLTPEELQRLVEAEQHFARILAGEQVGHV